MSGCCVETVDGQPILPSAPSVNEIGPAEDGTYTDGLYTDFIDSTPIGTPVDRFNEILRELAPQPAPDVSEIISNETGVSGNLSFGTSQSISGFTNVSGIGNLPAVDINGFFTDSSFSQDRRVALFDNMTSISGDINPNVAADGINYPAKSFGDADKGELRLILNGSLLLTVTLEGAGNTGVQTSTSANGSILNVTALSNGSFENGTPILNFKHRQGNWVIDPLDYRLGWNYLRVVHRKTIGSPGSDISTNYIDWVVDNDFTSITASSQLLNNFSGSGSVKLTGVDYFTSSSADYSVDINDAYRNVYSEGNAITFGGSDGISFSSQILSSIIVSSEDETKVESISSLSGSVTSDRLVDESITAKVSCDHPLNGSLVDGGASSISNILLFSQSSSSTVLLEDFINESFRLESGSYNLQSNIATSAFDNTSDRSAGSELVVLAGKLVGISSLPNSGDFSTITNGPSPNVDYSSVSGNLTYYRYFENNTSCDRYNFELSITGTGDIVTTSSSLGANSNFLVEIKLPEKTGWNVFTPYHTGSLIPSDGAGILDGEFDSSLDSTNILTFGDIFVEQGDSIVLRITANDSFTGEITSISLQWR